MKNVVLAIVVIAVAGFAIVFSYNEGFSRCQGLQPKPVHSAVPGIQEEAN